MGIINRITVGFKQILEIDADPTVNNTPAPIGSEAFFDDAGVGKSYLKYGASDTQWAAYQTGAEPSDWKFTTDANNLNVATAKSYFGTKAGSAYDIELRRNGVAIATLYEFALRVHKNIEFVDASGVQIDGSINALSLGMVATNELSMTGKNVKTTLVASGEFQNAVLEQYKKSYENVVVTSAMNIARKQALGPKRQVKFEIEIFIHNASDVTKRGYFKKEVHAYISNVFAESEVILQQDSMTSVKSGIQGLNFAVSYNASNELVLTPSGLVDASADYFKIVHIKEVAVDID